MDRNINFFKDKNLLVVGLGKTGVSVLNKMYDISQSMVGIDSNPDLKLQDNLKKYKKLKNKNIKIILDKNVNQSKKLLDGIDLIIISPGVSNDIPLIKDAEGAKIPVWSELELSWKMMTEEEKKNTIAVTGTNGKTTVVTLIGKIMKDYGLNASVCGNVGNPLIETIYTGTVNSKKIVNAVSANNDIYTDGNDSIDKVDRSKTEDNKVEEAGANSKSKIRVIEVSSFQLERTYSFKPHIGVILNITSDHIDRHRSMKTYVELKFKMILNQNSDDYIILNIDDENINKKLAANDYYKNIRSNFIKFSLSPEKSADIYNKDSSIFYMLEEKKGRISIKDILLRGRHNISNIMACIAAAKLYDVGDECIVKTLKDFKPLDHRLEYLGIINRVRCYNDSKSTNPDATIKALGSFEKEVTLILGGLDKEMNFQDLISLLNYKVNNLILIGKASPTIYNMVKNTSHDYKIYKCQTLEKAVEIGFKVTSPGKVLLLSPSCASMDMFKNYKERGEKFKYLVMKNKF